MNTKFKDALRNIKKEKVSFLSIVVIAAIAVCAYLGISFGASAIYDRADRYYKDLNFRDLEITSTLLLAPGDIDDLKKIEGVKDAEEIRFIPARASSGDENSTLTVISLTQRINKCEIVEGRLPENAGECVLEEELMTRFSYSIGDTITVMDNEDKCPEYLTGDTYEIVGSVHAADHYAFEHVVPEDRYMLVTGDAFSDEALDGSSMRMIITVDKPEGMSYFDENYKTLVADVKGRVDAWADEHEVIRTDDIHKKTDDKLKDAWDELVRARQELDENKDLIEDGKKELSDAKIKLDDAAAAIEEGKKTLDSNGRELEDSKKKLSDSEEKLKETKKTLEDSKDRLDVSKKQLDESKEELDKGAKDLVDTYNAVEDIKGSYRNVIKLKVEENTSREYVQSLDWADKKYITADDLAKGTPDIMEFKVTNDITIDIASDDPLNPKPILKKMFKGSEFEGSEELVSAEIVKTPEYKAAKKRMKELRKDLEKWNEGLKAYRDGLARYEDGVARYETGKAEYEKGEKQYKDGVKQYEDGKAQYEEGLIAYNDGKLELEKAEKEYKEGLKEYSSNLSGIEDAEKKLKDGEDKYAEGLDEYKDAKKKYEDMGSCYYVVTDVRGNPGFVHTRNCAENISKISVTFALLFIVLGFLVIYATVGRIVTEDRHLIGTQKALGFFVREVLMKYLLFGTGGTVIGALMGTLTGYFGIQQILIIAHSQFYVVKDYPRTISWPLTLIVVIAAALLSALSVWSACFSLLKETARDLLTDPLPKAGKRAGKGKKGGSLYARLILRNMIFDLPRVLITMISVAGCCVLLVIGFTMKDSIMNAINKQSNSIIIHDMRINYDSKISADAGELIEKRITEAGIEHTSVCTTYRMLMAAGELSSAEFIAVEPDEVGNYFIFIDPDTGNPMTLDNDGIYLSMKMGEAYGLHKGDTFTIYDEDMDPFEVRISGFYEYYCGKDMFITFEAYKKIFGEDLAHNQFWVNTSITEEELDNLLSDIKGYSSIKTTESIRLLYEENMSALSIVTVVMGIAAAMMAYFVLLNLTNMYLNRKKRELVVMRICGFTVKEVIRYVSLESVVTTIGGIIIGLGLGSWIGDIIVRSVEQVQICFFHQIDFPGWIWSALITLIYAAVIDYIAFRKIPHYKLYDIAG